MYEAKKTEEEIVEFWKKNQIYKKVKDQNKGKKPFYFLQGPPYTSGKIHIGQAWNNSLKDFVLRYKRMKGYDVWDRAGYDMHGLPTESKVMKKLGFKFKDEIVKYGIEKFIKECINFSVEHAHLMNDDLFRLGIWMDYENAYMPIDDYWMESVWWLVKQAHDKKRLYEGDKTITWCAHCETALAKHECEYKVISDKSIFVKFKVKGTKNEYLLIWSTTPWTLPLNLAIMVNPEFTYVKAKVEDEVYIIAKELADPVIKNILKKDYKILKEIKGEELEGIEYEHPLGKEIKDYKKLKAKHPKVHTVVLSNEHVTLEAGTGLVHTAPGCGPEDYEIGYKNNIPPYNPLDERGIFPDNFGSMSKWVAKVDDSKFIQKMTEEGMIIGTQTVEHDYAHCERCHTPVIYRATKQWFFKIEDLKERMLELNKSISWVPDSTNNAFNLWLGNLRDNSITKQRFWGTPLPIWKCKKCGEYTVIESKDELSRKAGKTPENLHKPWIDEITIDCKCGEKQERIPDVMDVWIDSGVASWACLYYPKQKDNFEKLFPADFILEAREQARLWYSMLMICSTLALNKSPFKSVYNHGMITDVEGVKMSKSLGNVISPYEVTDKYGADTLRFYMCSTNAGEDINFSWDEVKQKYKSLMILWNVHQYLIDYCKTFKVNPTKEQVPELEEKYILSKLNRTIKKVTELFEFYHLDEIPSEIEKLFLELSREYIQSTREKVTEKPELVLSTIYKVMLETIKMLAPVTPFISEKIYQNFKKEFKLENETISQYSWPKENKELINEKLEEQMEIAQKIIQAGLSTREKAKKGVRWPLRQIKVISKNPEVERTIKSLGDLIKLKLNIKGIELLKEYKYEKVEIVPNKGKIGKDFKQDAKKIIEKITDSVIQEIRKNNRTFVDKFELTTDHITVKEILPENLTMERFDLGQVILVTETDKELEAEGYARELARRIQDLRKKFKLKKQDKIKLAIHSFYDISKWKDYLQEKTGAETLDLKDKKYSHSETANIKDQKFEIYIEF
ncbi:MAG: isoleucine--tRNA ligase [Candidatus Woesearchaeota archaeon]